MTLDLIDVPRSKLCDPIDGDDNNDDSDGDDHGGRCVDDVATHCWIVSLFGVVLYSEIHGSFHQAP